MHGGARHCQEKLYIPLPHTALLQPYAYVEATSIINKQKNKMQMGVRFTYHKINHFSLASIVAFSTPLSSLKPSRRLRRNLRADGQLPPILHPPPHSVCRSALCVHKWTCSELSHKWDQVLCDPCFWLLSLCRRDLKRVEVTGLGKLLGVGEENN